MKVDLVVFKDDRILIVFVYDDSKGVWIFVVIKKVVNIVIVVIVKVGFVVVVVVKFEDVYKDVLKEYWVYNIFK